jgi:hypothetical protein
LDFSICNASENKYKVVPEDKNWYFEIWEGNPVWAGFIPNTKT